MKQAQTPAEAAKQLRAFVGKFEPTRQTLIRAIRRAMRKRLPAWNELVYDNYNFFVIGYGPTERPSDAALSIAAGASGVSLCFIHGKRLPDPHKLLQGSGTQTRFVRLESMQDLARPELETLIDAAIEASAEATQARGRLIIRSISAKQRPRRNRI